jgi:RHS repeat-associated protein
MTQRTSATETLATTYDALGNLVAATATVPPAGPVANTYRADGRNRRVQRLVGGTPATGWLYRDGISVVAELDGAGVLVHRYVHGLHDHVPDLLMHGDTATYRLVTDHLGSVRAVVRTTDGILVEHRDFDPWGVPTQVTSPEFQSLGYAGGLTDLGTNFIRFGARDYSPQVGRWSCVDLLWPEDETTNLWAYVDSNPLNFIDDNGQSKGGRRKIKGDDPLLQELQRIWDRYAKGEISREQADRLSKELAKQAASSNARRQAFAALLKVLRRGGACFIVGALVELIADPAVANPADVDSAPPPHVIPGVEVTAPRPKQKVRRK